MKTIIFILSLTFILSTPILGGQPHHKKAHKVKKHRVHKKERVEKRLINKIPEKYPHLEKALSELEAAKKVAVGKGKIMHLKNARKELLQSKCNRGGHKAKAINYINKSLQKFKKKKVASANIMINRAIGETKSALDKTKKVSKPQPHMESALKNLNKALKKPIGKGKMVHIKAAKSELQKAAHNKGGFRVKAIGTLNRALKLKNNKKRQRTIEVNKLIRRAQSEIKQGIAFGNK